MPLFEVCKHEDHDARMLLTKAMKDQEGEITQIWRCEECKKIKVTTTFGMVEDIRQMPPDQLSKNPFGL